MEGWPPKTPMPENRFGPKRCMALGISTVQAESWLSHGSLILPVFAVAKVHWRESKTREQGHEAELKALALKVVQGEASPDEIPDYTKDLREMIRFLKKMPELRKAFE